MLARFENGDGLIRVEGDRSDEMHGVDGRIGEDRLKIVHAPRAADIITRLLQTVRIRVAERQLPDVRVFLVDRRERAAEAQPHQGNIQFFHIGIPFSE